MGGVAAAAVILAAAAHAVAQEGDWRDLPRMQLEATFGGPLRDTIIQRLHDPQRGILCYIYMPITAPHTPPAQSGFVQYGPNDIGSISCVSEGAAEQLDDRLQVPAPRPAE